MKKRRRKVFYTTAMFFVAWLVYWASRPAEPTYRGESISNIIDDQAAGLTFVPFEKAITEIGTNALPFVVRSVALDDSKWHKTYANAWNKLPQFAQRVLPRPKQGLSVYAGGQAFSRLHAEDAPHIVALLRHPSVKVRLAALAGLELMHRESPVVNLAVPDLVTCLKDPDGMVCWYAIDLLQYSSPSSNTVLALAEVINDANYDQKYRPGWSLLPVNADLRPAAAEALGKWGQASRTALPVLRAALKSENIKLRGEKCGCNLENQ